MGKTLPEACCCHRMMFCKELKFSFDGVNWIIESRFYDTAFFGASDTDANFRTCLEGKYGFVHEELATCRQHASNTHRIISQSCLNLADWLLIIDRYRPRVF